MDEVHLTPTHCPGCGQRYGPGLVNFTWRPCSCPGASSGGHHVARCQRPGCGHVNLDGHIGPEPEPERMPRLGRHG